jgi:hypothetical protein
MQLILCLSESWMDPVFNASIKATLPGDFSSVFFAEIFHSIKHLIFSPPGRHGARAETSVIRA